MGGATVSSWSDQIKGEQRSKGSKDPAHLHVLPLPPIGSLKLLATVYPGRGETRLVPAPPVLQGGTEEVNLLHTSPGNICPGVPPPTGSIPSSHVRRLRKLTAVSLPWLINL